MKNQSLTRYLPLPAFLGTAALLAACAGDPVYVTCPEITAPPEGTAAFMKMDETGEVIDVRMNGVRGLCQPTKSGKQVDVAVGLKLKRAGAEKLPAGVAEIELMGFIVDADDNVVTSDRVIYKTGFADGARLHYPVAEYSTVMTQGQRLVLSLVPAL